MNKKHWIIFLLILLLVIGSMIGKPLDPIGVVVFIAILAVLLLIWWNPKPK